MTPAASAPAPAGFLLAQIEPSATTGILIGGLEATRGADFHACQALLWFVDAASRRPTPPGLPPDRLQIVAVESLAPAEIVPLVERFCRLNPRHLPGIFITDLVLRRQTAAYRTLIDQVHAEFEDTRRARLTRQLDGFTWQRHLLGNIAAYARHRMPDAWTGALRGVPAFICGAGPSLDVSIATLATHADRAVVFSADSALRALARRGIAADFAVSIDAAKVPAKCRPDSPAPAPQRMILASISPPAWCDAVPPERTFFLSSNQVTDDWLATLGVARTALGASESCGSTALDLAYHLGCDPICLFGLDLAVDTTNPARRHHQGADAELYKQSNFDPTAQLPRVPGNYADTVPCFALGDWRALDARLPSRTNVKFLNVTDRGARLRGTTVVAPGDFALATPPLAKTDLLARLAPDTAASAAVAEAALRHVRAAGERCAAAVPALRAALAQGGPAALSTGFRSVLVDSDCGRLLGAFSLKLMPHLVPPLEGDPPFWASLLDEYAELARLAAAQRD